MLAGCGALPGGGVLSGGGSGQTGGRGGGAAAGPGGRSAPGVSPPGMVCGEIGTVIPEITAVDVLIVIDASAAMNDDASGGVCSGGCGAGSKWAQAAAAIDHLVGDTNSTVNWGLEIFPDPGSACAAGGGVTVPVGPARAAAIAAAIKQRTGPNGGVTSRAATRRFAPRSTAPRPTWRG